MPDEAELAAGLARDGVLGPAFVAQLRAGLPEVHRAALHLGATSQDLTDTALTQRLGPLADLLDGRIAALVAG
ncbi:hypothetical protein J8J40_27475, partial [Mycobacterium tuberculosis]|nr:hypothetical protein [Mycobacterium tuberculosis]